MNEPIVRALGIHKIYNASMHNELHILKGIDIEIEKGRIVSIVGPSGAGKSTLLHILGGLDKPSRGSVILAGEDIYKIKDAARSRIRNKKVGFVFQFFHLLAELDVLENVMLPAMMNGGGRPKAVVRKSAETLLDRFGIGNRLRHRPAELSGGEQQRAAIARALINEPDVILCDEPTGNLDSASSAVIFGFIEELNKAKGQSFIVATHDEAIAARSHRTLHIKDGVIE
ncbi:MAG: hypothetical protein AUJ75_04275 [Candidatus Omnitrophica bacterium CG1_02_49_10]|nr:MAG: hypothetical protein AUJ75_04275 [Candidatus Omnitrophica bacterium CG1_02_49_10]